MIAKPYLTTFCLILAMIVLFFFTACAESESETLTPDRDAGETTAATLAVLTGGIMDQVADLREFLVLDTTRVVNRYVTIHKTYDLAQGLWNITYEKLRGTQGTPPYAYLMRKYTLQYKNVDGFTQQYYVTGLDTARTVQFNLVEAEGNFQTRRISHMLDSLNFEWNITNAHRPYVTLNGIYYKAGRDTITGWSRVRTSDHALDLTLSDISIPRGYTANFQQAVSGTITGTFDALITFLSGTAYGETTIHRDINIILGDGQGEITIGNKKYLADLYQGELID